MKNAAERPKMASVMGICAGLAGPKTENVDISSVLVWFFEGSKAGLVRMGLSSPAVWDPRGGIKGGVNPPFRRKGKMEDQYF